VASSRWRQMPDGPWVLPDEESGIFVRIVAKLERPGQAARFTVTGPGYDTTEHASLDEAKEAAEEERYKPFVPRVNPCWPPMPDIITAWPLKLYVEETTWSHWQGSATEIERLAKRGEEAINRHFTPFQKLPRDAWYIRPGIFRQQEALYFTHSVVTRDWEAYSVPADGLRDEIEARRALVSAITIKATVTDRTWAVVALKERRFGGIFQDSPLMEVEPGAQPGASDVVSPPQLIELDFQTDFPAVRLRTIARTPYQCAELHRHMLRHVAAGKRKPIWDPALTGSVFAVLGFAIPDVLLLTGVLPPWWTMILQFTIGPLGMLVPLKLIPWTFPPLELIDAWERSRWTAVRTWFWQGLIFLLAVVGIILTILLSRPGGATRCRCHAAASVRTVRP